MSTLTRRIEVDGGPEAVRPLLEDAEVSRQEQEEEATTLPLLVDTPSTTTTTTTGRLSRPLYLLFALNGLTLALPTTSLLYLVNTRVKMPVELLSIYAALSFLPFSLKPLFAVMSDAIGTSRSTQIAILLLLSGGMNGATAFLPNRAVLWCFVLGMLRTLFVAWPEFLLGLTLIDQANSYEDYKETVSRFQSEAATARSVGSLLAHGFALAFFAILHPALNDETVTVLMMITGAFNILGSVVATVWLNRPTTVAGVEEIVSLRPSQQRDDFDSLQAQDDPDDSSNPERSTATSLEEEASDRISMTTSTRRHTITFAITLQVALVWINLRPPVSHLLAPVVWSVSSGLSLMVLIAVGMMILYKERWLQQHKVGLFLILRHAIPNVTYVMESYLYAVFASHPMLLQLFAVLDMAGSSVACWSYGKLFSKHVNTLVPVIGGTTTLASIVGLSGVWLVQLLDTERSHATFAEKIAGTVLVKMVLGFFLEWKFLPDVVLATVSVDRGAGSAVGIQYGTLLSCLEFGDQIGALLGGPLVAFLGTTREDGWQNLDVIQLINSCMVLGSIPFLVLLR